MLALHGFFFLIDLPNAYYELNYLAGDDWYGWLLLVLLPEWYGFAGLVLLGWRSHRSAKAVMEWRNIHVLAFVVLLASTLVVWLALAANRRSQSDPLVAELRQQLPVSSTVFWQRPLTTVWLDLRRANYADSYQGASALFSQSQAYLLQMRWDRLHAIGLNSGASSSSRLPAYIQLNAEKISYLCADAELDFVLADGVLIGADKTVGNKGNFLSIFDCSLSRVTNRNSLLYDR